MLSPDTQDSDTHFPTPVLLLLLLQQPQLLFTLTAARKSVMIVSGSRDMEARLSLGHGKDGQPFSLSRLAPQT